MSYLVFYFVLIILNLSILVLIPKLSSKFNLYDFPNERKLHQKPISYLGGLFFLLSHFFYLCFYKNFFFEGHFLMLNLSNIFSLLFVSTLVLFIGLLDDKVDLTPLKKSVILLVFISSSVLIDNQVLITNLKFELIEKTLNLKNFSIFFSILCIYIFINASNMYDGADLQLGIYFLIIFLYLYFKTNYFHILTPILIPLIFFLYANYKKISFLGNNGAHFLSYIVAVLIIKYYNLQLLNSVEEILIIMLIPGLDLIRLFFLRILNNKKFFEPDLNHIHHILMRHNNHKTAQLILIFITISPIVLGEISGSYFLGLLYGTVAYCYLVFKKYT